MPFWEERPNLYLGLGGYQYQYQDFKVNYEFVVNMVRIRLILINFFP
jgi:hypothetical protein